MNAGEDRFDIPQRTGGCPVCGWETWDGDCNECEKRSAAAHPLIEAVCSCGFRRPAEDRTDDFRVHMAQHEKWANEYLRRSIEEAAHTWHIEEDGIDVDLDRLSGAERRRAKGTQ
jgi:hypothetical protein